MAEEKKKYRVQRPSLWHNGKKYTAGKTIDLTDTEAKQLLSRTAIEIDAAATEADAKAKADADAKAKADADAKAKADADAAAKADADAKAKAEAGAPESTPGTDAGAAADSKNGDQAGDDPEKKKNGKKKS